MPRGFYAETSEEMLLMAYVDAAEVDGKELWFLDSGCSNHMCGKREMFTDLDDTFRKYVKLGNNSSLAVLGKGDVRMEVNGIMQVITGVFYVPDLHNNLLSIGQLQEKGLVFVIKRGKCKIYHPKRGLIWETAMSTNRMFTILARTQQQEQKCLTTIAENQSQLWHRRYGHLGWSGLKLLQQKDMVKGLPTFQARTQICEHCLVGKQQRNSFTHNSTWRASQILQLVHADICGPITPISNSKKRYLISFIDDYSRKVWVYFLIAKSEAFHVFKKFKAKVEKETSMNIQGLRTDRGGEFISLEFTDFCRTHGIRRQLTASYTPQQNGVAERKNRTIMNMVRSMLTEKEIPRTFWPEAVNWTIHVLNRSPTFAVRNMTPEEAWSGCKPSVEHFRIFGCVAHVHIPDSRRVKLDDKSMKCILLGISDESKAYRLYNPISQAIVVSRDVIFEEEKVWDWNQTTQKPPMVDLEWEVAADANPQDDNNVPNTTAIEYFQGGGTPVENDVAEPACNEQPEQDEEFDQTHTTVTTGRVRRQPSWMNDYISHVNFTEEEDQAHLVLFAELDPITYAQAMQSDKWQKAMDDEIAAIERNHTWELTEVPANGKVIGVKWIYKTKLNEKGEVDKYKARLVAKGYSQQYGIDYSEVFAPVARLDTVRIILSIAAQHGWTVFQLDVKSAFLHGDLSEDVYVAQPPGYEQKGFEHKVYKLKKALYGLKQAPRAWYSRIESYFLKEKFTKCPHEHTLFIKQSKEGKLLIVCLYVDDLIYTGDDESMCRNFKQSMMTEFEMTDLGKMSYFLGLEVLQSSTGISISQRKYAQEVLERFKMDQCNAVHNPIVPGFKIMKDERGVEVDSTLFKRIVGSLMYLSATRPDMMYAISLISRFMERPTEMHLNAAKRVLRYLKGTMNFGLVYRKGEEQELIGYSDSDYAGDQDDRKSTSGYVFMLSAGAVSWCSKKQPVVTLSTTEAEFIAAASSACQAVWLRRILQQLGHEPRKSTTIYCDNSSTIKLSKNPVLHGRSKHIDVRFHFLRELTKDKVVELIQCSSQEQVADIMTKPLKLDVFQKLRTLMGVYPLMDIN
jgi:transposase InsO family protein